MTGLIYKDALIKKLSDNAWNIDEWELPHEQVTAGLEANAMDRETVEGMPTIDAVPVRHGKWIYGEHDIAMCDGYRCSNCGYFVPWDYSHKSIDYIEEYKYCPFCGARMDEERKEE